MNREIIILALNGFLNENILGVLAALGDPKAERNLVVNIDTSYETGNEKDGKTEWMQHVEFVPNPFNEVTTIYIYWYGKKNKNLRWEIAFLQSGGSNGVQNSLHDALSNTIKYFMRHLKRKA